MQNRIRDVRLRKGKSQQWLAEKLKISRGALSGYETGQIDPPLHRLEAIAEALKCNVGDLIKPEPEGVQIEEWMHKLKNRDVYVQWADEPLSDAQRFYLFDVLRSTMWNIENNRRLDELEKLVRSDTDETDDF